MQGHYASDRPYICQNDDHRPVTYYGWDYENRLTEVKEETSLGTVIYDEKFTYDVNGNRIGVSLNGTQQLYTVYDGKNPYIDFNGSGTLTERYLANPQSLSQFYGQVSASGTTEWFLTDNIGSIRQVVSTSGSVLDAITYDPFGSLLSQTNSANAPRFLYTGGAYDSNTGTYLDGAREDNPVDGRWLSQDPLGFGAGDTDLYRYVGNDPVRYNDPTGFAQAQAPAVGAPQAPPTLEQKVAKALIDIDNAWNQQFAVPRIGGPPFSPPAGSYMSLGKGLDQWELDFATVLAKWQASGKTVVPIIQKTIELLGDANYYVREKAMNDLRKIGAPAYAFLVVAAAKNSDLEIRRRARDILDKMAPPLEPIRITPERL